MAYVYWLAVGVVSACPPGWEAYIGERCMSIFREQRHFRVAEGTCQAYGGHLISVPSQQAWDTIRSKVGTTDPVWIGLEDPTGNMVMSWTDGSILTFAPMNLDFSGGRCTLAFAAHNGWDFTDCSLVRPFICAATPGDAVSRDDFCYYFSYQSLHWNAAERHCQELGGHLVVMDTHNKTAEINKSIIIGLSRQQPPELWIGLEYMVSFTSSWVDRTSMIYQNWATAAPSTDGCVYVNEVTHWGWRTSLCSSLKRYMCQLPSGNCPCPRAHTETSSGMRYYVSHTEKDAFSAAAKCEDLGGNLASVNTEIQRFLFTSGTVDGIGLADFYYIDNHDFCSSRNFENVRGESWTNWDTVLSEPNHPWEHCTVVGTPSSYAWHDLSCAYKQNFICEFNTSLSKDTATTSRTTESALDRMKECICSRGQHQGACHFMSTARMSWEDGQVMCRALGGDLFTLTDSNQIEFLTSGDILDYSIANEYWVNLRYESSSTWRWGNGVQETSATLNPIYGSCGFMTSSGVLGNEPCIVTKYSLCSFPNGTLAPSVDNNTKTMAHTSISTPLFTSEHVTTNDVMTSSGEPNTNPVETSTQVANSGYETSTETSTLAPPVITSTKSADSSTMNQTNEHGITSGSGTSTSSSELSTRNSVETSTSQYHTSTKDGATVSSMAPPVITSTNSTGSSAVNQTNEHGATSGSGTSTSSSELSTRNIVETSTSQYQTSTKAGATVSSISETSASTSGSLSSLCAMSQTTISTEDADVQSLQQSTAADDDVTTTTDGHDLQFQTASTIDNPWMDQELSIRNVGIGVAVVCITVFLVTLIILDLNSFRRDVKKLIGNLRSRFSRNTVSIDTMEKPLEEDI